jgi:bifunctional UDP-N-acetylglucosamine pyrophosphorylase/glucosamine-1-phosphate N-acetyltransferase
MEHAGSGAAAPDGGNAPDSSTNRPASHRCGAPAAGWENRVESCQHMATARPSLLSIAILAAGEGKRMRSGTPKVLHPLGGRPLLAHVVETARKLAPQRICVVYGHGGDAVRQRFPDPELRWALQDPPQGTGHALAQALPQLASDGVTLVLFGADPLARAGTLESVVRHAREGALSLLTIELDDPAGYGRIVRGPDGGVRAIVEHKDATPEQREIREINTGVMAAPTACFARWLATIDNRNASGEYYLTDAIALAVKEGVPVVATRATSVIETLGVNTMRELAQLERLYQRAQADALLDAGVTLADPDRIDIRGTLDCGADVAIDVGCVFEGTVRLGAGVAVGANCVLKDASIAAGSQVLPFSHLEGATIGANCRVGPYARLRPGAKLADDVHIGNFVEVKASSIGHGSKANHLAYIGDTTMGADVNFGAGSITANYDGANKHPTVIEDGASIGSNCVLVAPVRVGRGATIGGGSTIAAEAPAETLTVARARQVSVQGWKRPVKKPKPQKG